MGVSNSSMYKMLFSQGKKYLFFFILSLFVSFKSLSANRHWVASSASNWNNTANWSATAGGAGGSSVPGVSDVVYFDNVRVGDCSIDANVSINRLIINTGYTGTISQGTFTINISTSAVLSAGVFNGGSGNITIAGAFTLSGTNFTSTSGILEFGNNTAFTSGTFTHNSGTVRYNSGIATSTISGTSPVFYVLEFVGVGRTYAVSSSGNVSVLNKLTLSGSQAYIINTGVIDVSGDIDVTNTATGCGGSATININGTGSQNFTGGATPGLGALPKLTINKSSGTLNLFNSVGVSNTFLYSAGTVNPGTSTFFFSRGSVASYAITGSLSLNNITFNAINALTLTISSGTTLTANGILSISGTSNVILNTGAINVKGDINLSNSGLTGGGSATINITGTSDQTIDGSSIILNQSRLPLLVINKSSGSLFLVGNITLTKNLTLSSGTVVPGTSTVYVVNSLTLSGTFNLYNVNISAVANVALTISTGSTVTALNDFTLASGAFNVFINTGTLAVQGNIINTNTGTAGGGTGTILINGSNSQTISSSGVINQGRFPAITINKTGSNPLTITGLITVIRNWTYIAGTLQTTGSTVVFANTMTITGSHSLDNVEFEGVGNYVYTIASGSTITVNSSMKISGSSNVTLNSGNINLAGDLILTNTGIAGGGTAVLTFNGSGDQSITSSLSINQSRVPSITINKASGTLTFPSVLTVRGNWVYTSGTLDVATNNSTVVFANTASFTGSHTLRNVTLDASGNYTYTFNTGTILTLSGTLTTSGASNITISTPVSAATAIQVQGDVVINNAGAGGGGTGTLLFNGTSSQSITGNAAASTGKLPFITIQKTTGTLSLVGIISVSRGWTYTSGTVDPTTSTVVFGGANGSLSSAGMSFNNVTVASNVTTLTSDLTVNGNISITGGVLSAASRIINLKGNWSNFGTAGFTESTSTLNLIGAAQSITCPGGDNFSKIIIAGTGNKTLINDITIASSLTFTAGLITTGANKVIMTASGSIVGAGSGKYVFGNLQRNFATGSNVSRSFDIGNSASYLPVTIVFPTVTTAGNIIVSTTDGDHPQISTSCFNASKSINRYWTLSNSGVAPVNYNATFNFLASDVDPLVVTSNVAAKIYTAGTWKSATVGLETSTSTQITSSAFFGDIQIADPASTSGSWTGSTDSDWNNSANWCGGVPLAATDVVINASVPNAAQVTLAGGACNNLTISNGASLTILSGNTLSVNGNLTNNGTFASSGTVQFTGTSTQSISSSTITTFNNISVTNTASPGVQIETSQDLNGVLTLASNVTFDADGSSNTSVFRLLSSSDNPTQDAAIATLPAGAQVTGNVTVQRFMSIEGTNNGRIYRYISSPIQNATVADLQNEIPVTGTFTGTSVCSGCATNQSMFGYDETVTTDVDKNGVVNMNDGYTDFPDAANTETFQSAKGYSFYVRGDIISSAMWDLTGTINSGTVTWPVTFTSSSSPSSDGWNLVGNPFPSTIDWNAASGWTKTNLGSTIYIPDNGGASSTYATWNGVTGTNGGSQYIAMGQAFWVKASSSSPVLRSTESVKSAGTQTTFFRKITPTNLVRITLADATTKDEAVIHFRDDATALFDDNADAWKLYNSKVNVSSVLTKGKKLAINSQAPINCESVIKLAVDNVATGSYSLNFTEFDSFESNIQITLRDKFTNTTLDVRSNSNYAFTVASDTATYGSNRFEIIFSNAPHADFTAATSDICQGLDQIVHIANSQQNVSYSAYIGSRVVSGSVGNGAALDLTISKDSLNIDGNTVIIRASTSGCSVTQDKSVTFNIEPIYAITSVQSGKHCRDGEVTLQVSGAPSTGSYNWYTSSNELIADQHAAVFKSPVLSNTETYYAAVVNALGCEGALQPILAEVIQYNDVAITTMGDTLMSNFNEGNQWYFNGELIADATSPTIIASKTGDYSVQVNVQGCTTTTNQPFVITGLNEIYFGGIKVYPNPVASDVNIEISAGTKNVKSASILSVNGQVIGTIDLSGGKRSGKFDMRDQPAGIYLLNVVKGNSRIEMKLIKK